MNLIHASFRFFFLVLVSLLSWQYSGFAQMFDNPITAKVYYVARGIVDTSPVNPRVVMDFGGTTETEYFGSYTGDWEDGSKQAKVVNIGEEYAFDVDAYELQEYEFVFSVPPNMRVYLDGSPVNAIHSDDISYLGTFTIVVLAEGPDETQAFGTSTGLATGKLRWAVGLGELSNGQAAGSLILSQDDIGDTTAYKPDGLEYTENHDEVDVVLSGGVISQINTPEGLLDINTVNSSKYDIDVYDWSQITGYSGGQYTTTGSPYVTYTVDNPGDSGGDRIRIQKDVGTVTYETIGKQETDDDWEVLDWHKTTASAERKIFLDKQSSTVSVAQVIDNGTATVIKETEKEYTSGGAELDTLTAGTSGTAPVTSYTYSPSTVMGDVGNPDTVTPACGNEFDYDYYDLNNYDSENQNAAAIGEVQTMTRPFLDGGVTYGDIITTYTYDTGHSKPLVASITELATEADEIIRDVSITYAAETYNSKDGLKITRTEKYNEDAGKELTTITKVYHYDLSESFYRDQIHSIELPNGTKTSYLYQKGSWNDSTNTFTTGSGEYKRITIVPGLASSIGGVTTTILSINGGSIDTVYSIKQKTIAKEIVKDPGGNQIWELDMVLNSSGTWSDLPATKKTYDGDGNLIKTERTDGTTTTTLFEASYVNNQLDYQIDEAGIKHTYTYDNNGRLLTSTKVGWDDSDNFFDQDDIITTYTYDADGNVIEKKIKGENNTETIITEYDYDNSGRVTKMTAPGGYETDYTYYSCTKKVTIDYPDGSSETRDFFKDGRPKTVSGSAVPNTTYTYDVLTTADYEGYQTVKMTFDKSDAGGANDQWVETWTDWLGRTVKVVKPAWDGGTDVHEDYTYNSDGQLTKIETKSGTTSTKLAPTRLFDYNDLEVLYREAVDADNDGVIDTGDDRLTEYYFHYEDFGSIGWYKYEDVHVYNDYGSGSYPNKKTKTSFAYTKMSKFGANELFYRQDFDSRPLKTVTTIEVDRANKRKKIITDLPNASGTVDVRKTFINGLLSIDESIEGSGDYVDHKYQYDHLGRLKTHDDPRIGNTTTTYYTSTAEVKDVTAPDGQKTTYDYDTTSGALIWVRNHNNKYTRYETEYSGEDRWLYTWGDVPNPHKIKYDDLGRKSEMHTYQDTVGVQTWDWPTKPGGFSTTGDKTTWAWDSETGLLNSKTDDSNESFSYQYNDIGQVSKRTDAEARVTNYYYFTSGYGSTDEFTSELRKIDYYNTTSTTDVEYTYTRFGALKTVKDAANTRTFNYRSDLQIDKETFGGFYDYSIYDYDLSLRHTYEGSSMWGRSTGFYLYGGSTLLDNDYEYDAVTGRLDKVTGHGKAFDIYYLSNSHLINEVQNGSFERHITRESNSNHISAIESEWSNSDRVRFTYTYDSMGRESTRTMYGTIEGAYGSSTNGVKRTYTYTDRNELKTAGTEAYISSTWQELVARDHTFNYDHQGNGTSVVRNGNTTSYTTNSLNQYTARNNDHNILVEGTSTNATVKVYETGQTQVTASRKDDYYFRDWDTGGTANDYPEINIKEGTTVTYTGDAWIPKTSETITHDDNGNLTEDALWKYTYDFENRLIKMEESTGAATAGFPDTTITFKYDYLGRRIEKKVVQDASTVSFLRFVWRDWMLVAEFDTITNSNVLDKSYTWGPDISGTFGGVGGNGGVLILEDHDVSEKFYPAYDRQGNVYGLIDMSGNLDAAYEYDPFGKLIRYSGARKDSCSLLYATKYTDMETGLIYYGHRYYDPKQGRFINRDPIAEAGGINLYAMVRNNLINRTDYLGLNDNMSQEEQDYYNNNPDAQCADLGRNCGYDDDSLPFVTLEEFIIYAEDQKDNYTDIALDAPDFAPNDADLQGPASNDGGGGDEGGGGTSPGEANKVEETKEDKWSEEKCKEWLDYIRDLEGYKSDQRRYISDYQRMFDISDDDLGNLDLNAGSLYQAMSPLITSNAVAAASAEILKESIDVHLGVGVARAISKRALAIEAGLVAGAAWDGILDGDLGQAGINVAGSTAEAGLGFGATYLVGTAFGGPAGAVVGLGIVGVTVAADAAQRRDTRNFIDSYTPHRISYLDANRKQNDAVDKYGKHCN